MLDRSRIVSCWLGVIAMAALVPLVPRAAGASVLCQKKRGAVVVRDACKDNETQLDLADFAPPLRVLSTGTADTLAPHECAFVFVYGVGSDSAANTVVAFYILDVNDQRIPSLDNETAFEPGTVFETSQGGTIAYGRVCNLSSAPKDLPQGWKIVTRQL